MSDFKKQFDELQEEINNRRVDLAKFQERKDNFEKEIAQLKENAQVLNISIDDLDKELEELGNKCKEELAICNKKLNN